VISNERVEKHRVGGGGCMPIDERWERLGPSDWDAFALAWIAELRGASKCLFREPRRGVLR
jgi:hypothetical protein